ncbi:MAG: ribonuclease R [Pseudomonadota bacterium]
MAKRKKAADPHAAREASRYDKPIPSREFILDLLTQAGEPLQHAQIARELKLNDHEDVEALRKRLRAMERDGQLMLNRRGAYGLVDRLHLVHCRIQGHRDGYGFGIPVDGSEDIYLNARQMNFVFDGDEALVNVTGEDRRGRLEGKVVEVLEREEGRRLVGRYQEESGIGFLVPDNPRISQHILIPPKDKAGAGNGQIVTAEITHYPTRQLGAKGRVIEILGDHLDPGLEIDVAIRSHDIPYEWPEAVLAEAASLEDEPLDADKRHRADLRELGFVTIDGEDARDFDDAVYCEKRRSGWRLWVAIADVSHYVRPGAPLDEEADKRGNSVYFPERVVPMLPEALSNGLCSLKPAVDRLAMVCEMELSKAGSLTGYHFYEAVIHSHARLTYTQVGEVLETGKHPEVDKGRVPDLKRLHSLYKVLRAARDTRGAIDFETVETRIIFDAQRKIEAIVPVQRNDAHKLIEECMLCANVAAARFFEESGLPALYRVHDGPSEERLENLRTFLGELGLNLGGGDSPTPEHYQALMADVEAREDTSVIQTMMLRSLSQAVYHPENRGHFGLHYPAYAHFTSPIRRYPDLLVHRGLRALIRSEADASGVRRIDGAQPIPRERIYPYDIARMAALGEHCSMTERRADDATREVQAWLKCEYLQYHVGDEFDGVIAAVTSFGLFVELKDLYIEGLVHISALPGDYYNFDHAHQRLVGERSGRVYGLGAAVRVQVARVDLDDKKIDLELLDASAPAKREDGDGPKPKKNKGKRGPANRNDGGKGKKAGARKTKGGKTGRKRKTGLRKHY